MELAIQVQIQNEVVYILHSTNTLGKGMNPTIFPPAMGSNFGMTTSLGEGKL